MCPSSDSAPAGAPDAGAGPGAGGAAGDDARRVDDPSSAPGGTGFPLVVLAEDSPDVQGVVRQALEADGCDVRVAGDGEQALALLDQLEPDLLVLDLMMPRLSGLDVLTALRESGRLERLPVLVLTARSGEDDIVACLKMGVADYVTKPFMLRELRARASALLARGRSGRTDDGGSTGR